MKTRTWILLLLALLALCLGLSLPLLLGGPASQAEIWSDGVLIARVDLAVERELTVTGPYGENVVTVSQGRIAVTQADCPDGYCVARGFCNRGAEIVCLPNRLVIRFVDGGADAVVG